MPASASLAALVADEGGFVSGRTISAGLDPGERVEDVEFDGCVFTGCVLKGARLARCTFTECTFEACNLSRADLVDSRFVECRFIGCKALAVRWTVVTASALAPVPMVFERCQLDLGSFAGADLAGWSMRECTLREADLSDATLRRADLSGSDVTAAGFARADLREATMLDVTGLSLDPREARVAGLRLDPATGVGLLAAMGIRVD